MLSLKEIEPSELCFCSKTTRSVLKTIFADETSVGLAPIRLETIVTIASVKTRYNTSLPQTSTISGDSATGYIVFRYVALNRKSLPLDLVTIFSRYDDPFNHHSTCSPDVLSNRDLASTSSLQCKKFASWYFTGSTFFSLPSRLLSPRRFIYFAQRINLESYCLESLFNGVSLAIIESLSVRSSSGKAWKSLDQVHTPFVNFRDYQVLCRHSMPALT